MEVTGETLIEIERKWLVQFFPPIFLSAEKHDIRQAYPQGPGGFRIRLEDGKFTLTVKNTQVEGRPREEWTAILPPWAFQKLWRRAGGKIIEKTRHVLEYSHGRRLELDEFHGPLEGLLILEVEFSSEEEAAAYQPPAEIFIIREVTTDPRYKNSQLAVNNRPPE